MRIFLVILLLSTSSLYYADGCGTANVQCITDSTFQFCFTVGTQVVLVDGVQTCPIGTTCNENGAVVCGDGTTSASTVTESTTSASTTEGSTTLATGPPETCTTAGTYPADACDQYWECLAVMWWYELVLQTCATGLSYDSATQTCIADGTCASTTTTTESTTAAATTTTTATTDVTTTTAADTTTTTTVSSVTVPETCTEAGKYPADACNQYWECLYVMWWYELVLQTCDANQQFDYASQACVASTSCTV